MSVKDHAPSKKVLGKVVNEYTFDYFYRTSQMNAKWASVIYLLSHFVKSPLEGFRGVLSPPWYAWIKRHQAGSTSIQECLYLAEPL